MKAAPQEPAVEVLAARATVMLDARALDELGPATIDRLADLVANRLAERRAAGELPLLTVKQAAEIARVNPCTVRSAIHSGALEVAGYAGRRPRLRREDLDRWLQRSAAARAAIAVRSRGAGAAAAARGSAGSPAGARRGARGAGG